MRLRYRLVSLAVLSGVGVALPAPAADEPTEQQYLTTHKNLKQIVLAFHNCDGAAESAYAGNIRDKGGVPLLSWRVMLLPFLEEDELFKQFKLDEAWHSDHNKKLIAKMPKVYAPVRGKAKVGETFYQVVVGKGAIFEPGRRLTLTELQDDKLNPALVVEAGEPVVWTKPWDLGFDKDLPLPKLGGMFGGEFHAVLCDGSVIRVKEGADEKELKKLFMPSHSKLVDMKKLQQQ